MSRRRTPWLIGWEAAKANAAPAFVLQSVMLAILLAYYFHPPSAALLSALADFQQRHGLTFVLIASVIVGAVLPALFVIVFFQRGRIRPQNARNCVSQDLSRPIRLQSVLRRAFRGLVLRVEECRVLLRETAATAHLAILSRACLPGAGRDLGSLDPVNGGYLFVAVGAAISPFRPCPCFLGPHDNLHD